MEALIVILVIIIIVLVIFCLKLSKESKTKEQIVIEVYLTKNGTLDEMPSYRAQIKGRQDIFATGDTFYDAVGELVNSNREIFRVEYLGTISPD